MKNSKEVESFWVKKHPNGIYHLLFNTKNRWIPFHQYDNELYQIGEGSSTAQGGESDGDPDEDYMQEIPEGLIPNDISFISTTMQEKDQISFYFIPRDMIFRNGETIIYNSKTPITKLTKLTKKEYERLKVKQYLASNNNEYEMMIMAGSPEDLSIKQYEQDHLCKHPDVGTDGGGDYCKQCGKRW